MQSTRSTFFWLLSYFAMTGTIVIGMLVYRGSVVESYSTRDARENWQQWQQETRRLADGDGPVLRREASSDEPPVAVLLRDYFWVCLLAIIVMFSVIFFTFAFLLVGSVRMKSPGFDVQDQGDGLPADEAAGDSTKDATGESLKPE